VLRIQKAHENAKKENGVIVIFGKKGHAEVNGLGTNRKQCNCYRNIEEIDKIDFSKPIFLFSQTTKSIEEFEEIRKNITEKIENSGIDIAGFQCL